MIARQNPNGTPDGCPRLWVATATVSIDTANGTEVVTRQCSSPYSQEHAQATAQCAANTAACQLACAAESASETTEAPEGPEDTTSPPEGPEYVCPLVPPEIIVSPLDGVGPWSVSIGGLDPAVVWFVSVESDTYADIGTTGVGGTEVAFDGVTGSPETPLRVFGWVQNGGIPADESCPFEVFASVGTAETTAPPEGPDYICSLEPPEVVVSPLDGEGPWTITVSGLDPAITWYIAYETDYDTGAGMSVDGGISIGGIPGPAEAPIRVYGFAYGNEVPADGSCPFEVFADVGFIETTAPPEGPIDTTAPPEGP